MIRDSYLDPEDAAQVAELARLEAVHHGFDPEAAAREAVAEWMRTEKRTQYYEAPLSTIRSDWVTSAHKIIGLSANKKLKTPGQRKRLLRNQLIFTGALAGMSERAMATVFDLPHSRIHVIVKQMADETGITPPRAKRG